MDEAIELTPAQVEELRRQLEEMKRDLEARLVVGAAAARPVALDPSSVGRVSRMDALQSQALAKATHRTLELRLSQCNAALRAIRAGEYGFCRKCEEPVGAGRLSVRPEAPFCLVCQDRADQRQRS